MNCLYFFEVVYNLLSTPRSNSCVKESPLHCLRKFEAFLEAFLRLLPLCWMESSFRVVFIIPVDDEWNKPLEEGAFDVQTHLLHGLIHCNGFGHLVCINGIEGGSKYICGREIMDRICTALHARQITVEDLSNKHALDLRLLYGVAYGRSWFGRWGYRFYHG